VLLPLLQGTATGLVCAGTWRAARGRADLLSLGAIVIALFAVRESRDETVEQTVDVPGVAGSGNTQFVKLDAAGLLYDNDAACPCSGFWYITRDAGGNSQPNYSTAPAPGANSGLGFDTTPVTWIAAVPAGTTQTFRLRAARYASNTGNVFGWGSMTAATVPFGHTGTSALGPAGASPSLPTK